MRDMRKKLLGAEHPHTLPSMVNLAATYRSQERWSKTEYSSNPDFGGVMTLSDHHQLLATLLSRDELNEGAESNAIVMCISDIFCLLYAD